MVSILVTPAAEAVTVLAHAAAPMALVERAEVPDAITLPIESGPLLLLLIFGRCVVESSHNTS
jgi:hypothetical protein